MSQCLFRYALMPTKSLVGIALVSTIVIFAFGGGRSVQGASRIDAQQFNSQIAVQANGNLQTLKTKNSGVDSNPAQILDTANSSNAGYATSASSEISGNSNSSAYQTWSDAILYSAHMHGTVIVSGEESRAGADVRSQVNADIDVPTAVAIYISIMGDPGQGVELKGTG
jgi:hypothetical protein